MTYENIDDDFDHSCTWSSFTASDKICSRELIDGSCSRTTTEYNSMMHNLDATIEVNREQARNTSFFYEIFEIDTEEASTSSLKTADELGKYRQIPNKSITSEETEKHPLNISKYRKVLLAKLAKETPEQTVERKLRINGLAKKNRLLRQAKETPEQTAERLAKNKESAKKLYLLKQAQITPEKTLQQLNAEQKSIMKEVFKQRRQLQLAKETPEERVKRLSLQSIRQSRFRKNKQAKRKAARMLKEMGSNPIEANASEEPKVKYENIDDDFDESCTFSSFGGSEGIYSRTSIDGSCSRITSTPEDNSMMQYNSDATCEVKSEVFEFDSLTNKAIQNKEDLNIRNVEIKSEIEVSDYSIAPAIVQDIILKEELDL